MDISSMLEVQVNEYKEPENKEKVTPADVAGPAAPPPANISEDEERFFQLMFNGDISSIRFRKLHCTACDIHIGSAPASATNMFEHPVLRTLLCARCHEFYGDGTFEQGDDETDMFCRWCANGGNLYCCSTCSNTFCYKCIKRNFDPSIRKKIEADESWRCFVCDPTDLFPLRSMCRAIIQHVQTVSRLLQMDKTMSPQEIEEKMNLDESPCCPRKRKRRRRRTGSNSEEEDESYMPSEIDTSSLPAKRRRTRRSQNNLYTNGDADEEEDDKSKTANASLAKVEIDENSSPALHCEQTMIESENEIVAPDGKIIRTTQPQGKPARLPTLTPSYKKIVSINPIPTANLMKVSPIFQRKFKLNNMMEVRTPQIMHRGPRPMHPTPPMVSIPTRGALIQKKVRPRVILPRPRMLINTSNPPPPPPPPPTTTPSAPPSVINIESDDEDLVVIDSNKRTNSETEKRKETNDKIPKPSVTISTSLIPNPIQLPVIREKRTSPERQTSAINSGSNTSFKQILVQKNREIDTVLNTMKFNLKKAVNEPGVNYEDENHVAKRVKNIHRVIYKSIFKFAEQSDAIAYAYDQWREKRNRDSRVSTSEETPETTSSVDQDLPLEMSCYNESDEENDEKEEGNVILKPSFSNGKRTSMFDNFVFLRKRYTRDVGTGETDLSRRSIGIQAVNVEKRDLEKCIGYSLMTKTPTTKATKIEKNQSEYISMRHPSKYLEQYIRLLQHIEDYGIETEDERGLESNRPKLPQIVDLDESMEAEPKTTQPRAEESEVVDIIEEIDRIDTAEETEIAKKVETAKDIEVDDKTKIVNDEPMPATSKSSEMEVQNDENVDERSRDSGQQEGSQVKVLPDPNETPLKDLIEANSPFISEMLRSIGTPVLTNGSSPAKSQDEELVSTNSRAVEDLVEMVTKLSNDIEGSENKVGEETTQEDETKQASESLENEKSLDDEPIAKKCQEDVLASDDECALMD